MEEHLKYCPFNPDNNTEHARHVEDFEVGVEMDFEMEDIELPDPATIPGEVGCAFCDTEERFTTQETLDAHVGSCLAMHIPDQMGGPSNDGAQSTGMPAANPAQAHWIKCPVCPAGAEKYPDIEELRSHVIISGHNYVEPPLNPVLRKYFKPWRCGRCHRGFDKMQGLEAHIRLMHRGRLDMRCEECNRYFADREDLDTHKFVAHGGEKCPLCRRPFATKRALDGHLRRCHQGNSNARTCGHCGWVYGRQSMLEDHISSRHN
jgi:hypothetical protein